MKSQFTAALFAGAIAGALLASPGTASARSDFAITFSTGDVAFAYRDGWWDRNHRFHHWRHHERRWYQTHYRAHYYDWNHDRDRDMGWHRDHDYGRHRDHHHGWRHHY